MFDSMGIFSILIAASSLLAAAVTVFAGRLRKIDSSTMEWLAVFAIPLGAYCAHLLFGILQYSIYVPMHGVGFVLDPTQGGFMFYGAVAGSLLAAWITSRACHVRMRSLLEALACGLLVLIFLVRLAEPFDRLVDPDYGQGFGLLWADEGLESLGFFPLGYVVNAEYPEEVYGSVFLLEACWALFVLIVSLRRVKNAPEGETALRALILYASGQLFMEFIRQDYTVRWRFVRLSQLISAIILAVLLLIVSLRRRNRGRELVFRWIGLVACIGMIIAMEFADEKPLIISEEMMFFFPHWLTYLMILLSSVIAGWIVWRAFWPSGRKTA